MKDLFQKYEESIIELTTRKSRSKRIVEAF